MRLQSYLKKPGVFWNKSVGHIILTHLGYIAISLALMMQLAGIHSLLFLHSFFPFIIHCKRLRSFFFPVSAKCYSSYSWVLQRQYLTRSPSSKTKMIKMAEFLLYFLLSMLKIGCNRSIEDLGAWDMDFLSFLFFFSFPLPVVKKRVLNVFKNNCRIWIGNFAEEKNKLKSGNELSDHIFEFIYCSFWNWYCFVRILILLLGVNAGAIHYLGLPIVPFIIFLQVGWGDWNFGACCCNEGGKAWDSKSWCRWWEKEVGWAIKRSR